MPVVREMDIVIWTKNSSATLGKVFQRINTVIPESVIKKKIMVDDHSTDNTREIGEKFGWDIYENPATGIASGANEALRHVTSAFFMSIEHDLLLSKDWWEKIPKYMKDETVAVSQGIRFSTHPTLSAFDEYFQLDRGKPYTTIDNNLYRTEHIRKVGGFPDSCPVCIDMNLRDNIERVGLKWIIDSTVISQHIRTGIIQQLKHKHRTYLTRKRDMHDKFFDVWKFLFYATFRSPFRSFYMACKKKQPEMFFVYPMFAFLKVKSCLDRRYHRNS